MRSKLLGAMGVSAFVLLLISAGCGGGGGSASNSPGPKPITNPPTVAIFSPSSGAATLDVTSAQSLPIVVKVDDADVSSLHMVVTWDAGSVSPSDSTVAAGSQQTLTFTPPTSDKLCTVTVSVNDGEHTVTQNVKINVVGHSTQPSGQISIQSLTATPGTVQPGQLVSIVASVINPGSNPTYKWSCASGSINGSRNTATWTAPTAAGIYGVYLSASDGTTTVQSGCIVTVAGPSGGLTGDYFKTQRDRNVPYFATEAFSRVDPNINFDWEKIPPSPTLGPNGFGARWTGYIKCDAPGTYVFRAHVDDGVRMKVMNDAGVWVDVIPNNSDDWCDHPSGAWLPATTVPIQLNGGKWYPIQVEYFQGGGNAYITLYWTINGGTETIIPQEVFKSQ